MTPATLAARAGHISYIGPDRFRPKPRLPTRGVFVMKKVLTSLLAAVLLVSAWGCRADRDDGTGKGENQERLDATRGTRPGN